MTLRSVGDAKDDFADWYRVEHPRLVTALLLVAGDLSAAQDAANEACARALARWERVGRMAAPNGWVYRVGLNLLRRHFRRVALEARILSRRLPQSHVPAPAGEAWEAVRQLPPRQRTAVVLRFVADLTEEQVGVAMGVSRSTISSALADARRTLRGVLADEDVPLEVGCA